MERVCLKSARRTREGGVAFGQAGDGGGPGGIAGGGHLQWLARLPSEGGAGSGGLDGPFGPIAQGDFPSVGPPAGEGQAGGAIVEGNGGAHRIGRRSRAAAELKAKKGGNQKEGKSGGSRGGGWHNSQRMMICSNH